MGPAGTVEAVTPAQRLASAIERTALLTAGRRRTGRTHDDADDTLGTLDTDGALGFDPRPLLRLLAEVPTPVVVIGQVAGILHGSVDLTGDLDLLWSGDERHAAALASAFAAAGASLTDDDGADVPCEAAAFRLPKVQFATSHASGDCCTPRLPWGGLDVASFVERALTADLGDVPVRYLTLEDLISTRMALGRPKDLRRAAELRRLAG